MHALQRTNGLGKGEGTQIDDPLRETTTGPTT